MNFVKEFQRLGRKTSSKEAVYAIQYVVFSAYRFFAVMMHVKKFSH